MTEICETNIKYIGLFSDFYIKCSQTFITTFKLTFEFIYVNVYGDCPLEKRASIYMPLSLKLLIEFLEVHLMQGSYTVKKLARFSSGQSP